MGAHPHYVVYVHGYLAAGPVFEPLADHVAATLGAQPIDLTYLPLHSFFAVSQSVGSVIDALPADARVSLVGHSLGGLVARWYVEELGGASRVDRLVTLATPHGGTPRARIAPGSLGAALRPGSEIIRQLARPTSVRMVSMAGAADRVVPVSSARAVEGATFRVFPGLGHNQLLYARRVHDAVADALGDEAVAAE